MLDQNAEVHSYIRQHKNGVLLLAAGHSRRFGSPKLMTHTIAQQPLIKHSLAAITESQLPYCVVCQPKDSGLQQWLSEHEHPYILSERSVDGMAYSIADGIQSIKNWEHCIIALADMPTIKASTFKALHKSAHSSKCDAVIPVFNGKKGNPVAFNKTIFHRLRDLHGDMGAKQILHEIDSETVHVNDPGIHIDIDTPADLNQLQHCAEIPL